MNQIAQAAQALQPELITIRRHLHRHPELSFHEEQTARFAADQLRAMGCDEVIEQVGGHGVIASIHGSHPGSTIALRADTDALPVTEETGADYASEHPGVMHACGHDFHVTGLLGAAKLLCSRRDQIHGTVKLIFQPAEELPPSAGAQRMLDSGLLDNVRAFYGLHVWPELPLGVVGIRAGALMAEADRFTITIRGKSAHGARPDMGIDALVLGAQFVTAAQSIVSRRIDPMGCAVLTFGQLHAGTAFNIIPGLCTIEGTVRTLDSGIQQQIETGLGCLLEAICTQAGAEGVLDFERGCPVLENHAESADLAEAAAEKLFGPDYVQRLERPSMISEDYSLYLKAGKGAFLWLGTAEADKPFCPLHNSHFNVNEDDLWRAAALLAQIALDETAN